MWTTLLVVSCWFAFAVEGNGERENSRLINTPQGPVRGYRDADGDIFEYYNIPYATIPTGTNKFKAPLPPPVWTEPFEAIDRRIICPQNELGLMLGPNLVVDENCLIANIFTPDTQQTNLPVIIYVHGGGLTVGFGNWKKAKNLIRTRHMIAVTLNYRVGIHGYLCLGTENAPGNAAMKDQLALLRWVRNNIASFGGNPNDVTIAGYSGGSLSVDLLMISKAARGLFHKVIPESGSHLTPFTMQFDPIESAKLFARMNNVSNVDDISVLDHFYTTASFEVLTSERFYERADTTFVFANCVERDVGQEMFLDDAPYNILKSGDYVKVPVLHGFADMEGLLRVEVFDRFKVMMNEKFSDFLPVDLQFESEEQREEVANTIKRFYFGDQPVSNDNILSYIDYYTDTIYAYPTLKSIELLLENGHDQVYFYEYSFVDDDIPPVPHTNVQGAEHNAQTMAVLDGRTMAYNFNETGITEEYRIMKLVMREMWSNFIAFGEPVPAGSSLPAWPPINRTSSAYMSLAQTLELRRSLHEPRMRFWADIYERHHRVPIPPHATDSACVHKNVWLMNFIVLISYLLSWK